MQSTKASELLHKRRPCTMCLLSRCAAALNATIEKTTQNRNSDRYSKHVAMRS